MVNLRSEIASYHEACFALSGLASIPQISLKRSNHQFQPQPRLPVQLACQYLAFALVRSHRSDLAERSLVPRPYSRTSQLMRLAKRRTGVQSRLPKLQLSLAMLLEYHFAERKAVPLKVHRKRKFEFARWLPLCKSGESKRDSVQHLH